MPAPQTIGPITLLVRDQEEAIAFHTDALGFTVVEDKLIAPDKRWVLIGTCGRTSPCLLLARAAMPEQQARIGDQTITGEIVGQPMFPRGDESQPTHAASCGKRKGRRFITCSYPLTADSLTNKLLSLLPIPVKVTGEEVRQGEPWLL